MNKMVAILVVALILIFFLGCTRINVHDENRPVISIQPDNNIPIDSNKPSVEISPIVVIVADVGDINFILQNYVWNGDSRLVFSLSGPKLILNSNKAGSVDGNLELYDSSNSLIWVKNVTLPVSKGNQVIQKPFGDYSIYTQGTYKAILKLYSDNNEIFSKEYPPILVGALAEPISKSVKLELINVIQKDDVYNDEINFSIKLTNQGNAFLRGYYKVESYINDVLVPYEFPYASTDAIGFDHIPFQYMVTLEPQGDKASHVSYPTGESLAVFCQAGNTIKLKVSFIEVDPISPGTKEGAILATGQTNTMNCLNSWKND